MRLRAGVIAFAVGLLLDAAAGATVSLTTFPAPEELSIFAPEVTSAVASSLEHAGVEVAPSGGSTVVTGRIETIDADRVRLRAMVAPKPVEVAGEIERIDELCAELGARIAAAL